MSSNKPYTILYAIDGMHTNQDIRAWHLSNLSKYILNLTFTYLGTKGNGPGKNYNNLLFILFANAEFSTECSSMQQGVGWEKYYTNQVIS